MPTAEGYALVICEKPDAARRVAEALSGGNYKSSPVDGTTVFSLGRGGEKYVVCSAQGHVYGVSDPSDERTVYPVFDVEWYPSDLIGKDGANAARRIAAIKKLASGASKFVNACDFDIEGETIGFNLLRYACGGKESVALRAKFSTLTGEELVRAFDELKPQAGQGLARAGRARHVLDFMWGVNLSRALSRSTVASGRRYKTISVGRVQGPTMRFLTEREQEIRAFVPVPYWKVSGVFEAHGKTFEAGYSRERVDERSLAEAVRKDCVGKEGVAKTVRRRTIQVGPPVPFDTGGLQKEAYRAFRLAPSRTLQVAERLYLGAFISYPRTGSQKLPSSIDYRRILQGIGEMPEYSSYAAEILGAEPKPVQGPRSDPAHPAIYPTGEKPRRTLSAAEALIFDLVIRRFLAAFGASAERESVDVVLAVGSHEFRLAGGRTVSPGWMSYYGKHAESRDAGLPKISQGDLFKVVKVLVEEKLEQGPSRYNQGSLLERMEREELGTKATRADIIATLVERGYASGENLEVTDLGFAVVETVGRYAPSIVETALTRDIEDRLGEIEEGGRGEADLMRATVRSMVGQLIELNAKEEEVGSKIDKALTKTMAKSFVLGGCPVCRSGELRVVRSKTTKKRFVGCSNYLSGCRASAPLPQRGTLRTTQKVCERCAWPIVYVLGAGRPWRLCINPSCPGKKP